MICLIINSTLTNKQNADLFKSFYSILNILTVLIVDYLLFRKNEKGFIRTTN